MGTGDFLFVIIQFGLNPIVRGDGILGIVDCCCKFEYTTLRSSFFTAI
jgi:hypothetical protein